MENVARKSCPYCGNKEGLEHVACQVCGHIFKEENAANSKKKYYFDNDPIISEEDVAYLAVKEKEYKANVAKLVRAIVGAAVMVFLIGGEVVSQMLLKEACQNIYTEVNILVYIFLGVLLVLPWLFFISVKISKSNLSDIKDLVHKDNFSKAGKIVSIIILVLSILLILGGLALLTVDCIQIIPEIIKTLTGGR